MKTKLQRFLAGLLATTCIVSMASPAFAAEPLGLGLTAQTQELIIDPAGLVSPSALGEASGLLSELPQVLNTTSGSGVSSEDSNAAGNGASDAEGENNAALGDIELEPIQNIQSRTVTEGTPMPMLVDEPTTFAGGLDTLPAEQPQPHITVGSGKVGAEILQHQFIDTSASGMASLYGMPNTSHMWITIGIVDNRPESQRGVVTIKIKNAKGSVVATTTAKWDAKEAKGNVYWAYASVKGGQYIGVNEYTVEISSPSGTCQQFNTKYKVDTRTITNLKIVESDIFYSPSTAVNDDAKNAIVAKIKYVVNTVSPEPYTVGLYYDGVLILSSSLPVGTPGEYEMNYYYRRDATVPAGDRKFTLEINKERTLFENNYSDNTITKTVSVPLVRRPAINVTTGTNIFISSEPEDVEVHVRVPNTGSDDVKAPLNFFVGDKLIYSEDIVAPAANAFEKNIKIPFSAIQPHLLKYSKGEMTPTGKPVTVDCYGAMITCKLGNNTADYVDNPADVKPELMKGEFFVYWTFRADASIDITSMQPEITEDSMNRFRVTVKNESPVIPVTVHFEIETSGYGTVVAYTSEPIYLAGGQTHTGVYDIYCQNAAGENTVTARLLESDDNASNNSKVISYSVEMDTGAFDLTSMVDIPKDTLVAGAPLNFTSIFRVNVVNPDPLPDVLKMKVEWFLNGKVVKSSTEDYRTGESETYYHNYGAVDGEAYGRMSYTNPLTGKDWEYTTDTYNWSSRSRSSALSMMLAGDTLEGDESGTTVKNEAAAPMALSAEPRAGGMSAKGKITWLLNGKSVGQENVTLNIGKNTFFHDYDGPSWVGKPGDKFVMSARLEYTNPGTGEKVKFQWEGSTVLWEKCRWWANCEYEYNISGWGSRPSGGGSGGGGSDDGGGGSTTTTSHSLSMSVRIPQPKTLPTTYPGSKIYWYVDDKVVAVEDATIMANAENSFTYPYDTSTWTTGEHTVYCRMDTGYVANGKPMELTSEKKKIRVIGSTSIFVKDLKMDKSSYKTGDRMSVSFKVTNRTPKDIPRMRMVITVPGTNYIHEEYVYVDKLSDKDVGLTLPTQGLKNGKPFQFIGDYSIRVMINLNDNGSVIEDDDNPADNVASVKFSVTDSQVVDVAVEDVKLTNPESVYGGTVMPIFALGVYNYYSQPIRVNVYAKSGTTVLYSTTLNLGPATLMKDGSVSKAGYALEQPLNIVNNGNYNIVWSVEIDDTTLRAKESNKSNNQSKAIPVKVDVFQDLAVSSIRCSPGTVYENQSLDVYYTVTNAGNVFYNDIYHRFNVGSPSYQTSGEGVAGYNKNYGPYYSKELRVRIQSAPDQDNPGGASLFANMGRNIPVSLSLSNIPAGQNAIKSNDSATCYVNNLPLTDVSLVPDGTKATSATLWRENGDTMPLAWRGSPLAFVDLKVAALQPSSCLLYPNAVLRIRWEGHDDWYSPVIPTLYLGELPFLNGNLTISEWSPYSGLLPVVYDGKGGKATLIVEVDPGEGQLYNNPNSNRFLDENWSNNVKKFEITFPEFPIYRDLVARFDGNSLSPIWAYGSDLDLRISWSNRMVSDGTPQFGKREIFVNGVSVWTDNSSWPSRGLRSFTDHHFTTAELEAAGVDLSGDRLTVRAEVNMDKAYREEMMEDDQFYQKEYENNTDEFSCYLSHDPTVDFAVGSITTDADTLVESGQKVSAAITFRNLSSEPVKNADGTPVDVQAVIKLNGTELTSHILKGFGGKIESTTNMTFSIPKSAVGQQTLEVTINPLHNPSEINYTNNSKYVSFICEVPETQVDMGIFANPVNYTGTVGDAPKTITFDTAMGVNKNEPYSNFNTVADIYINGVFKQKATVTWNSEGKSKVSYIVPADIMQSSGFYSIEARINPDKLFNDINPENDGSRAGLTVKPAAAPDDYYVSNVKINYLGGKDTEITASYVNFAKTAAPELLCELEIYEPAKGTWTILSSTRKSVESGTGITSTFNLTLAPSVVASDGAVKVRATINRDKKYAEPDFTNNQAEGTCKVNAQIDVSAEWIKCVPAEEYANFQEIIDKGGKFSEVTSVMPGDTVYMIAYFKNNSIILPSNAGTYSITTKSKNGVASNNNTIESSLKSLDANSGTYVGSVISFQEDDVDISVEVNTTPDANPANNKASTSLPVKQVYVKNLTADSVSIKSLTTGSSRTIMPGDKVEIVAVYHNDMFDFDSHEWRLYIKDANGKTQIIADHTGEADTSLGHNIRRTITLTVPSWAYYELSGNLELILEVDPANKIDETNENDNRQSVAFTFYNTFDMSINNEPVEGDLSIGDDLYVQLVVDHTGKQKTVNVPVDIYWDGVKVDTKQVRSDATSTLHYTMEMMDKGEHTLRAVLNPVDKRVVDETTYDNNEVIIKVTVGGDPDLSVPKTWEVTNMSNPGQVLEVGDTLGIIDVPVTRKAMRNVKPLVARYRFQPEGIDQENWKYAVFVDGGPGDSVVGYSMQIPFTDWKYLGDDIGFIELNPEVPEDIKPVLEAQAAKGGYTINWQLNNRQWEEVDYTNNTTKVRFHINEHPDYFSEGYSTQIVNGNQLKPVPWVDGVSYIENSQQFAVAKFDAQGIGLFTRLDGIPYNVYHVDPDGTKTTITTGVFDKFYTVGVNDEGNLTYSTKSAQMHFTIPTSKIGKQQLIAVVNEKYTLPEDEYLRANNTFVFNYEIKADPNSVNFKPTVMTLVSEPYDGFKPEYTVDVIQTGNKVYKGDVYWALVENTGESSYIIYQTGKTNVQDKTFTITGIKYPRYVAAGDEFTATLYINPRFGGTSADVGPVINNKVWVTETDYTDNLISNTTLFGPEPLDVVAKSLEVIGNPVSAQEVELKAIVRNDAKMAWLNNVEYQVYFNGELMLTDSESLDPGEDTEVNISIQLPRYNGVGNFEIRWNTDSQFIETNYDNNSASTTKNILKPQLDLIAVSLETPNTVRKNNEEISFTVKIKNSSDGVDSPKVVENVNYIITDTQGNQLFRGEAASIGIDETFTETISTFVPGDSPYGPMKWILEVNPESLGSANFKDELTFDNNTTFTTITIDPPRNLVVTDGALDPDTVPEGDVTTVKVTIKNVDPTKPYTPDIIVIVDGIEASREQITIPAGGEIDYSKIVPDLPLGEHEIEVKVNPEQILPEDNYDDNSWSGTVNVRQGKDFSAELDSEVMVVSIDKTFAVTATFKSNFNKAASAPYYISYKGTIIKSGTLSFKPKESKNVVVNIPAGNTVGFADIEAGINIDRMADEEYDSSNNRAYLSVRVRDHNVDGKIDSTPLDKDDPVIIEIPADKDVIDNIISADDPTSIIEKIELPDGTIIEPGVNEEELDIPIKPGEEIKIIITITTDDGEVSEEYEVIFRRPKDDIDAVAYVTSNGIQYKGVRVEDTFTISLPSTVTTGILTLEATEEGSYISEVEGDATRDAIVYVSDLTELFSERQMTVYFSGTSGSGNKTKDFVVKISIDNTPPTIEIVNTTELDGSVFNRNYGRYTDGITYAYGPAITSVPEALDADKTRGIVVEVLAEDKDPEQYIFAEITFMGRKYPISWNDYTGVRTTSSGSEVRGFAYIPSSELTGNSEYNDLRAYVYDTLSNTVGAYLSTGESHPVFIDIDNEGPDFELGYNVDQKIVIIRSIMDNNVGQKTATVKAKPSTVSSWGAPKSETVEESSLVTFEYPELSRQVHIEATLVDRLGNKTVISDTVEFPSEGTTIEMDGVYATNSRKAVSLFINVRYRGAEEVDLLGFGFLAGD